MSWLLAVLRRVEGQLPRAFAGLGVILYSGRPSFPCAPLAPLSQLPRTPVATLPQIASCLADLADGTSRLHDGFHFLEARSRTLTHMCQFVSPRIPAGLPAPPASVGARYMTAFLCSMHRGVIACATVGPEVTTLFRDGERSELERVHNA